MGTLRKLTRHSIGHHKTDKTERIPFGYRVKMSDALVQIAQPMIDDAQDEEQFRLAIGLAAMSWNLSLTPAEERPAMMDDMLSKLVSPEQSLDDVRHAMTVLIARKEALFPADRRLITDYRVSGSRGDANIVVEYSPPGQK